MQNTKIEWTDHTVNFWWGCTKVSRACKHCYAESVAKVFGKRVFGTVPEWGAGKPRFERLEAARKEALKLQKRVLFEYAEVLQVTRKRILELQYAKDWGWAERVFLKTGRRPQRPRVFVNSMSDWLDDEVPVEWLAFLLETLNLCPNVDFQLLTKRPENWRDRMCEVSSSERKKSPILALTQAAALAEDWCKGFYPENVWIGCTVEDQAAADARIPHLLKIPAKVRFLSCEPLVGPICLYKTSEVVGEVVTRHIHWAIAGGESGGKAEPSHPEWFRRLRTQCGAANVPFFFKQWGEWLPVNQMRYAAEGTFLARAYKGHKFPDDTLMLRVGVDTAGDLLDGVLHHDFPISA